MAEADAAKPTVWVKGLYDVVLMKVEALHRNWPRGDIAATRPFLTKQGAIENIPTRRKLEISWHPKEFAALVEILERERPTWQLTLDLAAYYRSGFRLAKMLTRNERTVPMIFYELELKELWETLVNLKKASEKKETLAQQVTSGSFWRQ